MRTAVPGRNAVQNGVGNAQASEVIDGVDVAMIDRGCVAAFEHR
ncbi:MAG: hypothetical protein ABIR32_15935 [Ilumatobacteraceae bacterium]